MMILPPAGCLVRVLARELPWTGDALLFAPMAGWLCELLFQVFQEAPTEVLRFDASCLDHFGGAQPNSRSLKA